MVIIHTNNWVVTCEKMSNGQGELRAALHRAHMRYFFPKVLLFDAKSAIINVDKQCASIFRQPFGTEMNKEACEGKVMKRDIRVKPALLLIILFLLAVLFCGGVVWKCPGGALLAVADAAESEGFDGGNGSRENPYLISTATQLDRVRDFSGGGSMNLNSPARAIIFG